MLVAIKMETSVYELCDDEHAAYRLKILLCICKWMEIEIMMTSVDYSMSSVNLQCMFFLCVSTAPLHPL